MGDVRLTSAPAVRSAQRAAARRRLGEHAKSTLSGRTRWCEPDRRSWSEKSASTLGALLSTIAAASAAKGQTPFPPVVMGRAPRCKKTEVRRYWRREVLALSC